MRELVAHHSNRPCVSQKVLFIVRFRDPPPPTWRNLHLCIVTVWVVVGLVVPAHPRALPDSPGPWQMLCLWSCRDSNCLWNSSVCVLWFAGLSVGEWLKEGWEMADKYLSADAAHVGCPFFVQWVCCPPFSLGKVLFFKTPNVTVVSCCPRCLDWAGLNAFKHLKPDRQCFLKSA